MQRLDHGLEFDHGIRDREIIGRGEPCHGVVAPIVREIPLAQERFGDERLAGKQLQGGHADGFEMMKYRRSRQTQEFSAPRLRNVGMRAGVSLGVQFIDHRVSPGNCRQPIALPIEMPLDDPRPQRGGERQLARIGIDQRDGRIEAVSLLRVVRSMYMERVLHTRTGFPCRQESMPYVAGSRGQLVARRFRAADGVE